MTTTVEEKRARSTDPMQFATFCVGDQLMGVDIRRIQEINRNVEMTPVPHAPEFVRGVINLRGDVATVIDLRTILGLTPAEFTSKTRNVIIETDGEPVGLLVDRVADVITAQTADIEPPPANVGGMDGRFFRGVYKLETELLVLVDVDAVLSVSGDSVVN